MSDGLDTYSALINKLAVEAQTLKEDSQIKGRIPEEVALVIKFTDGHIHSVLPNNEELASEMLQTAASSLNAPIVLGLEKVPLNVQAESKESAIKIPDRIIFHNRQAIGDILMFTCMVRDFKKAFPHVKVKVMSTAMHIWDNNPYLDWEPWDPADIIDLKDAKDKNKNKESLQRALAEGKAPVLYIGPSRGTNESNRRDRHFANAYRLSVEDNLGISFDQGPIRPDIWMTKEEYNAPPLVPGKYWIIVAGEKGDWTAKTYPFGRWQEVVEALPEITFVQIGSRAHRHPALNAPNVINMIGQTDGRDDGIRKLFNLFLNAEGSAGLVSFQMHLAGAFNKPCVVIAGAREPVHFTRYPGQRYLSTDGCLPCTVNPDGMPTACWFCADTRCQILVEKADSQTKYPKCVDIITPRQVIEAIQSYYEGGRLSLKEEKKQIFKSIAEPHNSSELFQRSKSVVVPGIVVPQDLPAKYGMAWGGGCITNLDWEVMLGTAKKYNVKTILEFGAGLSTLLFIDEGFQVTTYETSQGWINKLKAIKSSADIRLWDGKTFPDPMKKFDMSFVDGPSGGATREFSTKVASESASVVIIHDAGREHERRWQDLYIKDNFPVFSKGGHRCHLWAKEHSEEEKKVIASTVMPTGPIVRILFNGRGDGGAERSVTWIANKFVENGYQVIYHSPNGKPCATFTREGSKAVKFQDMAHIFEPCSVLLFYVNDWCWELSRPQVADFFKRPFQANRKVMCLNYHSGSAGKAEWTKNWDHYLFLNSKLEGELLANNPGVSTKVMAPPIGNLDKFFEAEPDYNNGLRLIRHSSQGDSKYPKDFSFMVQQILDCRKDVGLSLMPSPSFLDPSLLTNARISVFKRNNPPVLEFIKFGNCFWYTLPPGYTEGGPKVIMEAMAAGLPCIVDNHSGMKDRVTEDTGWKCNSFEEVLEVIKSITPDILATKGANARKRAREEFVGERWLEQIIGKKLS